MGYQRPRRLTASLLLVVLLVLIITNIRTISLLGIGVVVHGVWWLSRAHPKQVPNPH